METNSLPRLSDAIKAIHSVQEASGISTLPVLIAPTDHLPHCEYIGSALGIEVYTRDDIEDGTWFFTYDKRMTNPHTHHRDYGKDTHSH